MDRSGRHSVPRKPAVAKRRSGLMTIVTKLGLIPVGLWLALKVGAVPGGTYVAWAPKNGGRQQDVGRVTQIVTDPRAAQYWDGHRVLTDAYDRMLALSGPCAGIFMLYGPQARWEGAGPPRADYLQDAHAEEFNRPYPQYDVQRFADKARSML